MSESRRTVQAWDGKWLDVIVTLHPDNVYSVYAECEGDWPQFYPERTYFDPLFESRSEPTDADIRSAYECAITRH